MLREQRKNKHLTQSQVAEKLNSNRSYVSRLEGSPHNCNPSLNTMLNLSYILELNRITVFEYFASSRQNYEPKIKNEE